MKERKHEYLARNLSQMPREAEQREQRLRGDLEQLRSQQEQTLDTLNTRNDLMMERSTHDKMERLGGLLVKRSRSRNRGTHSREASSEPRVNFNEQSNRGRTHGSTRGRGNPSSDATGSNRPRNPTNIGGGSTGHMPLSNERPSRDTHSSGRDDSSSWNYSNQRRAQPSDLSGGMSQSLKQRILTITWDLQGMQQRSSQRLNLLTDP